MKLPIAILRKLNLSEQTKDNLVRLYNLKEFIPKIYGRSILTNGRAASPDKIRIDISSLCNLRCRHCPTGTTGRDRGIMGEDVFNTIIEQIKNLPIYYAVFYVSGEPLMNKSIFDWLKRIKSETNVKTTAFVTNGMLMSESVSRSLANSYVDQITVSIDGATPEENDLIRRGSSYKIVHRNVIMAKSLGLTIIIGNVRLDSSTKVPEFLQRDFPGISIHTVKAMKWPGMILDKNIKEIRNFRKRLCPYPFKGISIAYNGNITLCCYDLVQGERLGNILDKNLMDIWNGPEYRKIRRSFYTFGLIKKPQICIDCAVNTGTGLIWK